MEIQEIADELEKRLVEFEHHLTLFIAKETSARILLDRYYAIRSILYLLREEEGIGAEIRREMTRATKELEKNNAKRQ